MQNPEKYTEFCITPFGEIHWWPEGPEPSPTLHLTDHPADVIVRAAKRLWPGLEVGYLRFWDYPDLGGAIFTVEPRHGVVITRVARRPLMTIEGFALSWVPPFLIVDLSQGRLWSDRKLDESVIEEFKQMVGRGERL